MSYELYSEEWQKLQQMLPMVTGVLEMISGVSRGTSWDINPAMNIFKYNRQDRPFATIDAGMYREALSAFNTNPAVSGKPSESNAEMFGRALMDYFGDGRGKAENALNQVLTSTGAGLYAFGSGGVSVADVVNAPAFKGRSSYSKNLVNLMAEVYGMETDPTVNKGQRQELLAGLLGANTGLVKDYANARYDKEKKATDSAESLSQMLDKVKTSLEGFGEAATSWSKVLNTDTKTAMNKLQELLGGSAFASFYGREEQLAQMGYDVKHVSSMTGHNLDYGMAMVQQAGSYLKERGGPADTAVQVAQATMMESFGMAGYRVTQEQADKMMLKYNANLQSSEAAAVYFGGFSEFVRQARMSGDPEVNQMSFDDLAKAWNDQIMSGGGVTVAHANRILNRSFGASDYAGFSQDNFARDLAAGPNGFTTASWRQMREDVFARLADVNPALSEARVTELSKRAGTDVLGLINMNENAFMEAVGKIRDLDTRRDVIEFRTLWERGVRTASANGELGVFSGQTPNAMAALMTESRATMIEQLDRQRELRSKISGSISGASISKTVKDFIQNNPNFTFGDLAVAAGSEDLDANGLDVMQTLRTSKKDMELLMDNIKTEDGMAGWAFRSDIDKFLRMVRRGQTPEQAASILKPYGVDIETAKMSGDEVNRLYSMAKSGDTDQLLSVLKESKYDIKGDFSKMNEESLEKLQQRLKDITGKEASASELNRVFQQFGVSVRDTADTVTTRVTQVSSVDLENSLKARADERKKTTGEHERLWKTFQDERVKGGKSKDEDLTVLEKMEVSSYQAMMDLARDYLSDGGMDANTRAAAKTYMDLFKEGTNSTNMEAVKNAFNALKDTELGDELMQKQVGYMSQMGVTMDQASLARVIKEVIMQTVGQINNVIKGDALNVNIVRGGN